MTALGIPNPPVKTKHTPVHTQTQGQGPNNATNSNSNDAPSSGTATSPNQSAKQIPSAENKDEKSVLTLAKLRKIAKSKEKRVNVRAEKKKLRKFARSLGVDDAKFLGEEPSEITPSPFRPRGPAGAGVGSVSVMRYEEG